MLNLSFGDTRSALHAAVRQSTAHVQLLSAKLCALMEARGHVAEALAFLQVHPNWADYSRSELTAQCPVMLSVIPIDNQHKLNEQISLLTKRLRQIEIGINLVLDEIRHEPNKLARILSLLHNNAARLQQLINDGSPDAADGEAVIAAFAALRLRIVARTKNDSRESTIYDVKTANVQIEVTHDSNAVAGQSYSLGIIVRMS